MMWVPAQKLSVYRGEETTLVCVVEAHPEALVYWEFNGQMVQEINGVVMRQIRGPPKYKVINNGSLHSHCDQIAHCSRQRVQTKLSEAQSYLLSHKLCH